ncbi:MAG: hypothetical protein DCF20_09730 [Pseudanabaena sp.]|nr:MAG: hypothetical protein DCF20_09730 [Pseudanabaena sp.]
MTVLGKSRLFLLVFVIAILIRFLQPFTFAMFASPRIDLTEPTINQLDSRISKIRMGDLVIKVIDD